MSDSTPAPRRIAKRSTTGVFLGLGPAQLVCVVLGILSLLAGLYGPIPIGLAILGVLIWATLGIVKFKSRPLVGWVWIYAGYGWRVFTRNTVYRFRIDSPRPVANLGLPGDAARLRMVEDPIAGCGYVHDPHANRLTAVLRVHHKGALLADPDDQLSRDRGFASMLASVTRLPHVAAVDILERTVPGGVDILQHLQSFGSSDLGSDHPIRGAYEDLAGVVNEGLRHESYLSLTLDLGRGAETIREMGGGLVGAAALMREVMHTFVGQIGKAGLTDRGWLNESALALMLRSVYDPEELPRLERKLVGRSLASAAPMGVRESFTYVQTDSAFHRVYFVGEWPQGLVGPMTLWPLILKTGLQRSFKLVARPIGASTSKRQARSEYSETIVQRRRRGNRRGFDDPQDEIEEADAQRKLTEITMGGREFRYVGLLVVTAPSLDELRKASRTAVNAAMDADVELRVLAGQQAQGLVIGALPFGRGIG